jgi:hypothetical protein
MEENVIEMKFNTADGANKCMFHIHEVTNCLTQIYHAINQYNDELQRPLPTDSLPISVETNKPSPSIQEQKLITLNWALTKAFEEFINGLTKTLKENYRFLHVYSLSSDKNPKTKEEFDLELKKLSERIEKAHFPEFIELVEEKLGKQLLLKEEVLTINQIRNCLVHRHGIVSEKDIKNSVSGDLRLKWSSLKFFTKKDGEEVEITYDFRKDGVLIPEFTIKHVQNEKEFKLGEKITLSIEDFNGISFTCLNFVTALHNELPKTST